MNVLSDVLLAVSFLGLISITLQMVAVYRHFGRRLAPLQHAPAISILKPLCGVDEDLADNLELFATLDYPDYELLLGVRTKADPAWSLAQAMAERHPGRVRALLQVGEPGLNPKVNQLITLSAAARHDLLVVSDSNVSVGRDYLRGIATRFADPAVGVVTHAVAGMGEQTFGSLVDNLHMTGSVAPGMVGAQVLLGQSIVVGKSMAVRRSDILRIGGFESMRDLLAEDFLIGQRVMHDLGKTIAIGPAPVFCVSRRRSLTDYFSRYRRWSVMHRMAVGRKLYLGGLALNPTATAVLAFASSPSVRSLEYLAAIVLWRTVLDGVAGRLLRRPAFSLRQLCAAPIKDLLCFVAWLYGLTHDTVVWRAHRLRVLPGTRLERTDDLVLDPPVSDPEPEAHAS